MAQALLVVAILACSVQVGAAQYYVRSQAGTNGGDTCNSNYGMRTVTSQEECRQAAAAQGLQFTVTNGGGNGGCYVQRGNPDRVVYGAGGITNNNYDYLCVGDCPMYNVCQRQTCNGRSCAAAYNDYVSRSSGDSYSGDPNSGAVRSRCDTAYNALTTSSNCPQCNVNDSRCTTTRLYSLPDALAGVASTASRAPMIASMVVGAGAISALAAVALAAWRGRRHAAVESEDGGQARGLVAEGSYAAVRSEEAEEDTDGASWRRAPE